MIPAKSANIAEETFHLISMQLFTYNEDPVCYENGVCKILAYRFPGLDGSEIVCSSPKDTNKNRKESPQPSANGSRTIYWT